MLRKIVQIDQSKCNGCELCVKACHEGAIQMLHGKATLISDVYCDGLGDCLPACPTGAIEIIEREAVEYSQEAVDALLEAKKTVEGGACNCSGCHGECEESPQQAENLKLNNWPVQIKLVNTQAEFLKGADLLVAADCTAFAYPNFHRDFVKNRVVLVGCPKLDDNSFYAEKLTEILNTNEIKSITVLRMMVPCCSGIVQSVKSALLKSGRNVPYHEVTITLDGKILKQGL